ncbi:MAG: hypothetical protein M1825_003826 [Sarcosagium campestre]|nr:MAG: hypothetical protein M1825_003826 [Sarcosagium campestre]
MNQNNRPFLNFGQNDRAPQFSDHAYPTTPSTFPQPSFPGAQSNQGGFNQQAPGPSAYGGGNQGYFGYQNQFQQPQAFRQQYQPQQNAYGQRQPAFNQNDATNGLAQQFSNQNLGPGSRQGAGYGRQAPPGGQRQRPNGAQGQGQYGSHLNPSSPGPSAHQQKDTTIPEKNPAYSTGSEARQKKMMCTENVSQFFKQNVERARDRNARQVELSKILSDPSVSSARKDQKYASLCAGEAGHLRGFRTKQSLSDYQTLKVIGKGAFGEVRLVSKKDNGRIFALKSLVKAEMYKKDQLAHVRAERDILAESESPWVVKLFSTFQDNNFLHMLMEFLPGGDLMTMLIKYEIFSEQICRFYIAEIALAIEAVHKLGFIHRDIKPDNILLDKDGHIKLTDFGLSTGFHRQHDNSYYQQLLSGKSNKSRDRNSVSLDQINLTVSNRKEINTWRKSRRVMAYSTVGTPDYIAPEIFSGQGYSFECDWWSLGTIFYECVVGWPPFCAEDPHDTYRKIVDWKKTLYFPEDMKLSPECEHLIRSLITDSSSRIGRVGAQEVKSHAFFQGVVFEKLRKIQAPFVPKVKSNVDVTYFPIEEIDQSEAGSILNTANLPSASQEPAAEMSLPFVGYTFKRFDAR